MNKLEVFKLYVDDILVHLVSDGATAELIAEAPTNIGSQSNYASAVYIIRCISDI